MARFVLQEHSVGLQRHYDLMLENGSALATWQVLVSLSDFDQLAQIPATKLPDHRLAYLEYQGPVSGSRGEVKIADHGTYLLLAHDEGHWLIQLAGQALRGRYELRLQQEPQWLLRRV